MKAGRDASAARGAVFGRWAKDFGLGEREMMLRGEIGLSRIAKLLAFCGLGGRDGTGGWGCTGGCGCIGGRGCGCSTAVLGRSHTGGSLL